MRPALCEDALRLGRILAELAPQEPEVHGLVALMEIQASRSQGARRPDGGADPAARSEPRAVGSAADPPRPRGARARRSARRRAAARTRSRRRLPPVTRERVRPRTPTGRGSRRSTRLLAALAPSPVVELNRAVAVAMAFGPQAGLELVDALTAEPSLAELPPAAERARRPARQARPARRGACGVRARGIAHAQRARARAAARAGAGMPDRTSQETGFRNQDSGLTQVIGSRIEAAVVRHVQRLRGVPKRHGSVSASPAPAPVS